MTSSTKWLVIVSGIALPSALLLLAIQMVLWIAPMKWWIEYESVVPLSDKVLAGTKPRFVSTITVSRECDLTYNDILFCKPEGTDKFVFTHEYMANSYNKQPGHETNEWVYGHKVWDAGECYLKSNIMVKLSMFGVTKVQTVIGEPFEVVNEY